MKKWLHSILFIALCATTTQVFAKRIPQGTYIQTSVTPSSLGECRTCRIDITKETPHIIKIVSSNNWIGYAYYDEASDTYLGASEWRYNGGGNYEGVVSKLKLKYDGQTLISNFNNHKTNFTVTYVFYD